LLKHSGTTSVPIPTSCGYRDERKRSRGGPCSALATGQRNALPRARLSGTTVVFAACCPFTTSAAPHPSGHLPAPPLRVSASTFLYSATAEAVRAILMRS